MFAPLASFRFPKYILPVLKLLLGLFMIAFCVRQIQWESFIETLASVNPWFVIIGLVLTLINMIIASLRWYLLLHALYIKAAFTRVVKLLFIGMFFNIFLPGGFAGDIVRSIQAQHEGSSFEDAISSVFTDRLLGLFGLVFFAVIGLVFQWNSLRASGLLRYFLIPSAFVCIFPIFFYNRRVMKKFQVFTTYFGLVGQKMEELYRSFYKYRHRSLPVAVVFGITLFNHLIMFASIYAFALSLDAQVSFVYFMLFLPIIGILSMVPVTIGGLGLREFGFVFLFPLVGMTKAQALGSSLFFFMALISIAFIGGFLYLYETLTGLMTLEQIEKKI